MAEHPTSNPHEAAIAREEMERLQAEQGVDELPPMPAWASALIDENERRFREAIGPEKYAEYLAGIAARRARRAWHDEERRLYHHGERTREGVAHWMAMLRPGDHARTLHDVGAYDGPPLPSEILTVERRTPSGIVVMTDGSKWNAHGYKRGETGSNGLRTYIAPE